IEDANFNSIGSAGAIPPMKNVELTERNGLSEVLAVIDPKVAKQMTGRVYIRVTGATVDTEFYVDLKAKPSPIELYLPVGPGQMVPLKPTASSAEPDRPAQPIFQSRAGTSGQQLRGGKDRAPIAVIQFHDVRVSPDQDGNAAFEMRSGIEHSGDED